MNYAISITVPAELDLRDAYDWLASQTPQHAMEWHDGILDAILTLKQNPARCPVARESSHTKEETRVLLYGNKQHAYRIFFTLRAQTVVVMSVRHAARNP